MIKSEKEGGGGAEREAKGGEPRKREMEGDDKCVCMRERIKGNSTKVHKAMHRMCIMIYKIQ